MLKYLLSFLSFLLLLLLLMHPIIVISIIIVISVLIYYYKNKKYKEKSYYKVTNVSYFDVIRNTGKYGEFLTYERLENFEKQGAKFLFNIYIPKKDEEETTEIDVLMISSKGLFVLESKNYSGWIFGSDKQKYWYQTLPSGRKSHKEKFYNPIFQNNTHIKYLKSLLKIESPIYSIITFSDRCTLKSIQIQNSDAYVINRHQVYDLIFSIYFNNSEDSLSSEEINEIYDTLYPYTLVDEEIRKKHIDSINNNIKRNISTSNIDNILTSEIENSDNIKNEIIDSTINDQTEQTTNLCDIEARSDEDNKKDIGKSLICPMCGSKLLLKTAKYGEHAGKDFYGCSNYPECKYIRNK